MRSANAPRQKQKGKWIQNLVSVVEGMTSLLILANANLYVTIMKVRIKSDYSNKLTSRLKQPIRCDSDGKMRTGQ